MTGPRTAASPGVDGVTSPASDADGVDPGLRRLAVALDDAGVRWAILRGAVDRPGDGDLDILVHPDDATVVASAARAVGFPRLPAWGHGHHRFHLGRGRGGWWRLDLVDELRFAAGVRLGREIADAVLLRRVAGPVAQLHPDDLAWALVLHLLLDREHRSEADRHRLDSVTSAGATGPLAEALAAALSPPWTPGRLLAALRADDPALRGIRRQVAASLRTAYPEPASARLATRLRRVGGARLRKPLTAFRRSGPSVALMGPDGAGKSWLIGALADAFPLPVRTSYLGLYPAGGARSGGPKGLGLARRLATLWARYARSRLDRWRGRLVVFDRHPFDARLPARGGRRWSDRLRRWLLGHALPSPDLVVILDAPGDVLHARKAEYPADVLEVDRQRYGTLARGLRRSVVVDASRPAPDVLDEVVDRIWTVWAARLDPGPRDG
jgi:thymidylate kinase